MALYYLVGGCRPRGDQADSKNRGSDLPAYGALRRVIGGKVGAAPGREHHHRGNSGLDQCQIFAP